MGHTTVTAELSDLAHYSVTARTYRHDRGCRSVAAPAGRSSGGRPDRDDGISFAGGLSIVAAGRPALRDRVAFVLSFGGHGDLPRTLHYLATGVQPDGMHRPPHDYGVAIILLGVADRVVPRVSGSRRCAHAILSFLEASRLDMVDKEQALPRVRARPDAGGRASGTVANAHDVRQQPRRRPPRPDPRAASHGARRRSGAVTGSRARRPPARSTCCTGWTTTSSLRSSQRCWRVRFETAASTCGFSRRRSSPTPRSNARRRVLRVGPGSLLECGAGRS